jgi:hypothetical protein
MPYTVQAHCQSSLPLDCRSKRGAARTARALAAGLSPGNEARAYDASGRLVARYLRSPATGRPVKLAV